MPPLITGLILLVALAILRGLGRLFSSNHRCKGRNNGADYNTPGDAIASRLAHIGEDLYRWTGKAAVVPLGGMCVWAAVAFTVGRRG
ncbi:hypothetical protein SLA_6698 [Streptomyces laurentii]|uniref:Uncharacterized protein n=1 Tax=Streptomyces laurentii TaxID=39478 RepID=A0A160P7Z3_STRLU|nr:hypothetical protein SLA_6698 [Streptomyces laurentii]